MAIGDWPFTGVLTPTVTRYVAPSSPSVVLSNTVFLEMIHLANMTAAIITFTLTNGDGSFVICPLIDVAPFSHWHDEWPGLQCVGLRSYATAAVGLNVQLQYA